MVSPPRLSAIRTSGLRRHPDHSGSIQQRKGRGGRERRVGGVGGDSGQAQHVGDRSPQTAGGGECVSIPRPVGRGQREVGRSPLLDMPSGCSTRSRARSQYDMPAALARACPSRATPRLLYAALPALRGRVIRVYRTNRGRDTPRYGLPGRSSARTRTGTGSRGSPLVWVASSASVAWPARPVRGR
jgi:hypothetical protein